MIPTEVALPALKSGIRSDQTIKLTSKESARNYPENLIRIKYYDLEEER